MKDKKQRWMSLTFIDITTSSRVENVISPSRLVEFFDAISHTT